MSLDFDDDDGVGIPRERPEREEDDRAPRMPFDNSPARKKRNRNISSKLHGKSDAEKPSSLFVMSQDSNFSNSQFSQDFTERFGQQMNIQCGEDSNEFCSRPDDSMSGDGFHSSVAPLQMQQLNRKRTPSAFGSSIMSSGDNAVDHVSSLSSKQITLAPCVVNPYLPAHCTQKRRKKEIQLWIEPYRERPKYLTEFEQDHTLGEGTFATVYCARKKLDGILYAIKKINSKIVSESAGQRTNKEVCALATLQGCPHIIQYYSSWIDNGYLHIQTELCARGSLEIFIRKSLLSRSSKPPPMFSIASRGRSTSYNSTMMGDNGITRSRSFSNECNNGNAMMSNGSGGCAAVPRSPRKPHSVSMSDLASPRQATMLSTLLTSPRPKLTLDVTSFGCTSGSNSTSVADGNFSPEKSSPIDGLRSPTSTFDESLFNDREFRYGRPQNSSKPLLKYVVQQQFRESKTPNNSVAPSPRVGQPSPHPSVPMSMHTSMPFMQSLPPPPSRSSSDSLMLPPATIPGRIEPDMFSSEDKNDAHDAMSSDANLKPEEVVEDVAWLVIEAIGGALHFMHERGVAHLDVRPANIFIAHRAGPIADEEFLHNQKSTLRCSEEKVGRSRQNSRDSDASLEWDTCAKCVARKLLDNSCTLKLGDFGHTVQAPAGSSSSSSSSSGKVASSHSSNPDSHVNSNAMNTGSDGVDNGGTGSRVAQSHGEVEEGETRYCARELIDRNGSGIDLQKCDIFSLGASVYELGLGRELSDSSDSKTTAIAVATAAAAAAGPTRSPARSGNASPLKQSMSLDSFSMSPPPNQISPPDVAEEWHNLRNGIFHERIRDGSVFGEDLLALLTSMLSPDPNSRPGAKDLVKIARARRRKKKEQSRDGSENEAWVDRSHSE